MRRINIPKGLRDLAEITNPALLAKEVKDFLAALRAELVRVCEELATAEAQRAEFGRMSTGDRVKLQVLAFCWPFLLLADIGLQGFIFTLSLATENRWAAPVLALIVVGGIAVAIRGGAALSYDHDRRLRSLRHYRNMAWVAFMVSGVAGLIILVARSMPTPPSWLIDSLWWVLLVVSLGVAALAGLLGAIAFILNRPSRLDEKIVEIRERIDEITNALATAVNHEEPPAAAASQPSAPAGPRPVLPAAVVALLLALGLTFTGPPAAGQPVPAFEAVDQGAACRIYKDVTPSVDPSSLTFAVDRVATSLPPLIAAAGCTRIRFTAFAGEGFPGLRWEDLAVPAKTPDPSCTGSEPARGGLKAFMVFSNIKSQVEARSRSACTETLARVHADDERRQTTFFAAARRQLQPEPTRGACTNVRGVLAHAVSLPGTSVVVSDGIHTCAYEAATSRTSGPGRVVLVLVPSVRDAANGGVEMETRAVALKAAFPTLRIVLPNDVTDDLWRLVGSPPAPSESLQPSVATADPGAVRLVLK